MGDSGSKIVSNDPPNVGNEQEKVKNPLQESHSENYNSTAPGGESSETITVAKQMPRTTLLNSLKTDICVSHEKECLLESI